MSRYLAPLVPLQKPHRVRPDAHPCARTRLAQALAACLVAASAVACGGSGGAGAGGAGGSGFVEENSGTGVGPGCATPTGMNNSTIVKGDPIGTGEESNDAIRVPVEIAITADPGWVIGSGFATRFSSFSDYAKIIFPVTNNTAKGHCMILAENLVYKDASGDEIASGIDVLTGSVGITDPSDVATDTCLGPGETGYVSLFEETWPFLARVEGNLAILAGMKGRPSARMSTGCYDVGENELRVTVRNDGASAATLHTVRVFLLDDAGAPLASYFIFGPADDHLLGPGASIEISDEIYFDGTASRAKFFMDFEDGQPQ